MWPEPLFHLAGFGVTWYHLLYGFGFLPALALALWLARERHYRPSAVLDAWLLALIAALAGGRLVAAIAQQFNPAIPDNWSFGQFLAVTVALGARLWLRPALRPRARAALDISFPPIALYLAIARIGCFTAGCCHGRPAWGLPWAVTFTSPYSDAVYKGIPLHPTQLYEAAGALIILGLLLAVRRRPAWQGWLGALFFFAYGWLRLGVEAFRGDVRSMWGSVSLNQLVCWGLVLGSGAALLWRARHQTAPVTG